jgi:hypothetical protein
MSALKHLTTCDSCGHEIALVMVVPEHPRKGRTRSFIPLDTEFDPAVSAFAASHALSAGRTTCRPLTADHPLAPHEHPALTHFASCPARSAAHSKAMPRPRSLALGLLREERAITQGGASALAGAASRAHSESTYWRAEQPSLAADFAAAAQLLEDRYSRVWKVNHP